MKSNRRGFVGALALTIPGFGAVAARLAPPSQAPLLPSVVKAPTLLPNLKAGDVLTAKHWNALVDAINEINKRGGR
jgi:hypothetical protein